MSKTKPKYVKNFKDFLSERKKSDLESKSNLVDWEDRKNKWLDSVENLYKLVDKIIVSNFKDSGYKVVNEKFKIRLIEEYVGAYDIDKYVIQANNILIKFDPIGTIIINAFGRVDMLLPKETIKLVLKDWDDWRIVSGYEGTMELLDFNEENIVRIFKDNL